MDKLMQKPVKDFMKKDVVSVKKGENIKNVFKVMDKHGILGLPVVSEDKGVIGVVTETDLLAHFTTLETPLAISILGSLIYVDPQKWSDNLKDQCAELVEDVMSPKVYTIIEDQTLQEAIELMAKKEVSRLPVVNKKGELVGIISRKDIVHQLAKQKIV